MFYRINHSLAFQDVLSSYANLTSIWYRPTAFNLFYWIGAQFFSWTNVLGWKLLQLALLICACWLQYLFTLEFLGSEWKLAAWFSALYLAIFPGQVSIVLQTSAFDPSHIVFALLSAILFLRALGRQGWRRWWLLAGSVQAISGRSLPRKARWCCPSSSSF